MNRLVIIMLLALMLVQTFSKVILVVDYQANKEYIMEFLCINRDKPQLACAGKCQLSKKLKQRKEAEQQSSSQTQKQEVPQPLFFQDLYSFSTSLASDQEQLIPFYSAGDSRHMPTGIFHPPKNLA